VAKWPSSDHPVQVVNWHDRERPPSLAEGQGRVGGGLRQWETMAGGSPDGVRREAADALAQPGGAALYPGHWLHDAHDRPVGQFARPGRLWSAEG